VSASTLPGLPWHGTLGLHPILPGTMSDPPGKDCQNPNDDPLPRPQTRPRQSPPCSRGQSVNCFEAALVSPIYTGGSSASEQNASRGATRGRACAGAHPQLGTVRRGECAHACPCTRVPRRRGQLARDFKRFFCDVFLRRNVVNEPSSFVAGTAFSARARARAPVLHNAVSLTTR